VGRVVHSYRCPALPRPEQGYPTGYGACDCAVSRARPKSDVRAASAAPSADVTPREPVKGWRDRGDGYIELHAAGFLRCHAHPDRTIRPRAPFGWRVSAHLGNAEHVLKSSYDEPACVTLAAAQLAAEDELAALLAGAAGAIGYDLVRRR